MTHFQWVSTGWASQLESQSKSYDFQNSDAEPAVIQLWLYPFHWTNEVENFTLEWVEFLTVAIFDQIWSIWLKFETSKIRSDSVGQIETKNRILILTTWLWIFTWCTLNMSWQKNLFVPFFTSHLNSMFFGKVWNDFGYEFNPQKKSKSQKWSWHSHI